MIMLKEKKTSSPYLKLYRAGDDKPELIELAVSTRKGLTASTLVAVAVSVVIIGLWFFFVYFSNY